ncbi:MAG: hypothetical protein EXS47_02495 [Candidatus Zambryskibacteria bacterium]|nr:hypothetical protein [Candidatus Zambryskibacteria bacterium]
MSKPKKADIQGFHPKIVARKLGVHLRTVFRMIRRGTLEAANGRVLITERQIKQAREDFQRSYTPGETRKVLGVSSATVRSWKEKLSILEYVHVFGSLRYLKNSVHALKKKMRSERPYGRFRFMDSDVDYRHRLIRSLCLRAETINQFIRDGDIPTLIVKKKIVIQKTVVEKIEAEWQGSCFRKCAARILGVPRERIPRLTAEGRIKEVSILGKRRILLSSIARTPEQCGRLKVFVEKEKHRLRRRIESPRRYYEASKLYKKEEIVKRGEK